MNFGNIENKNTVSPFIDGTCKPSEFAVLAQIKPRGVKDRTYYFSGEYRNSDALLSRVTDLYEYRDNRGNIKTKTVENDISEFSEKDIFSTV